MQIVNLCTLVNPLTTVIVILPIYFSDSYHLVMGWKIKQTDIEEVNSITAVGKWDIFCLRFHRFGLKIAESLLHSSKI